MSKKEEKASKNIITDKYSLYEILKLINSSDSNVVNFRNKCIHSGFYYKSLKRWLDVFNSNDILIIDSDSFRQNPIQYLKGIQSFFELKNIIDYKQHLVYDSNKLIYCLNQDSSCSSFQKITKVDQKSYQLLKYIYKESNKRLENLLKENKFSLPKWLIS